MPFFGIFAKKPKSSISSSASVASSKLARTSTYTESHDGHEYVVPELDVPAPTYGRLPHGSNDSLPYSVTSTRTAQKSPRREQDIYNTSPLSAPPTLRNGGSPAFRALQTDDQPLRPPPSRTSVFNGLAYDDHRRSGSTHSLPTTPEKHLRPSIDTVPRPKSSMAPARDPPLNTPSKRSLFAWTRKSKSEVADALPAAASSPTTSIRPKLPMLSRTKSKPSEPPKPAEESFNLKSFRHVRPVSPGPANSYTDAATSRTRAMTQPDPTSPTSDNAPRSRGGSFGSDSSQRMTAAAFRQAQAQGEARRSRSNLGHGSPAFGQPANTGSWRASAAESSDSSDDKGYPRRQSSVLLSTSPIPLNETPSSRPPRNNPPPPARSQMRPPHVASPISPPAPPTVPPIAARFMNNTLERSSTTESSDSTDSPRKSETRSTSGGITFGRHDTVLAHRSAKRHSTDLPSPPRPRTIQHTQTDPAPAFSRPPRAPAPPPPSIPTPPQARSSAISNSLSSYAANRGSASTPTINNLAPIQPPRKKIVLSDSDTSEDDSDKSSEEDDSDDNAPLSNIALNRHMSTVSSATVRPRNGNAFPASSSAVSSVDPPAPTPLQRRKSPLVDLNAPSSLSPNSLPLPTRGQTLPVPSTTLPASGSGSPPVIRPGLVSRIPSFQSRSADDIPIQARQSQHLPSTQQQQQQPTRPFTLAYSKQQHSSPASSTGDSSSGKIPLTPQDGSEAGINIPHGHGHNRKMSASTGRVSAAFGLGVGPGGEKPGHARKGSVTFQDPYGGKDARKSKNDDGHGHAREQSAEERIRERRRGEARNAIELGKVVNGPPPVIPDDEHDGGSPFSINAMQQSFWMQQQQQAQQQAQQQLAIFNPAAFGAQMGMPGMPPMQMGGMNGMNMGMPGMGMGMGGGAGGAMDPNLFAAHQHAMMIAKQTYQYAVAQQAMQAASDQWERSSNVSGFGGLNVPQPGMGGYGGMGMGMGMPAFGAMGMGGGSAYGGGSSYGGSTAPTRGGWGGSVYGESFGPPTPAPPPPQRNPARTSSNLGHSHTQSVPFPTHDTTNNGSKPIPRARVRTQTAPDRSSLNLSHVPPLPTPGPEGTLLRPPSSWRK